MPTLGPLPGTLGGWRERPPTSPVLSSGPGPLVVTGAHRPAKGEGSQEKATAYAVVENQARQNLGRLHERGNTGTKPKR